MPCQIAEEIVYPTALPTYVKSFSSQHADFNGKHEYAKSEVDEDAAHDDGAYIMARLAEVNQQSGSKHDEWHAQVQTDGYVASGDGDDGAGCDVCEELYHGARLVEIACIGHVQAVNHLEVRAEVRVPARGAYKEREGYHASGEDRAVGEDGPRNEVGAGEGPLSDNECCDGQSSEDEEADDHCGSSALRLHGVQVEG